jgi:hypothetical protein
MAATPSAVIEFGCFKVLPHRRELLADGQPVKIGGRAFDVLLARFGADSHAELNQRSAGGLVKNQGWPSMSRTVAFSSIC